MPSHGLNQFEDVAHDSRVEEREFGCRFCPDTYDWRVPAFPLRTCVKFRQKTEDGRCMHWQKPYGYAPGRGVDFSSSTKKALQE
jgi:hypothetical protein